MSFESKYSGAQVEELLDMIGEINPILESIIDGND